MWAVLHCLLQFGGLEHSAALTGVPTSRFSVLECFSFKQLYTSYIRWFFLTYGSHITELNRRARFDHTPAYLGPEMAFSLARQY
jgi:hypothetical protein